MPGSEVLCHIVGIKLPQDHNEKFVTASKNNKRYVVDNSVFRDPYSVKS